MSRKSNWATKLQLMLIAEKLDDDWIQGFYLIYQTFVRELKLFCWSAAFAWPPIARSTDFYISYMIYG